MISHFAETCSKMIAAKYGSDKRTRTATPPARSWGREKKIEILENNEAQKEPATFVVMMDFTEIFKLGRATENVRHFYCKALT